MIILGIDPGYAILGYGAVEAERGKIRVIDYGVVETTPKMTFPERLERLYAGTKLLLERYRPDHVAFEELFFYRNTTTALQVAAARGVAITAAQQAGLPLYEYTPMQIKQSVTGDGHADKLQMQTMVKLLLKLQKIPKPDDAADALGGGAVLVAEHGTDLDADGGQQAGDNADQPGSGQNVHLHGCKADTDGERINAGGDGQRQHGFGGVVVVQLLVATKTLLDHVRTDERQQHKRDPRAELRQQRGKPVTEKIAQCRHQKLEPAEPDAADHSVLQTYLADGQPLADRDGECVHREADGNQDQVE